MEEQIQAVESVETVETVETEPVVDDQPVVESETIETAEDTETPLFTDETDVDLGEGRNPVKLAELKSGYLRQSDYTKKTQALSEERKAFEAEVQQLEPARNYMNFINQNPYLIQRFNEMVDAWQNMGEAPPLAEVLDTEAGPYLNHLMAEVNRLQTELDHISGEYQETKFSTDMNSVMSDLKAEFKDLVTPEYEESLKQQAKEQGLSPDILKRIAKGDLAEMKLKSVDTKKIEAETIKKIQQNAATSTGSLAQEGAEHKAGYSQMTAEQKKALRDKVLRGERVQL